MNKWTLMLIEILSDGAPMELTKIYKEVERTKPTLTPQWKAALRGRLNENSDDLFIPLEKGSGLWRLDLPKALKYLMKNKVVVEDLQITSWL
jgi:hypothetical protein